MRTFSTALLLAGILGGAAGCDNMWHQEHYRPYDPSSHFPDGASARTPPAHTVPAGPLGAAAVATGLQAGAEIRQLPVPVTRALLERGRECYQAQCAECHGAAGYGDGIVVRRGFPAPPSFHDLRLRQAPAGHFYQVLVHGYGLMYPAAPRVSPADRWAIVAYIRALQLSQHARVADLSAAERRRLPRP